MTVQWTTVEIPVGAGIDTKTNEKLLRPPFVVDLVDAIFPASGVSGYETRRGYDYIQPDVGVSYIDTLVTRQKELTILAENKMYSVFDINNATELLDRGNLLSVEVQQETLDSSTSNQARGSFVSHEEIEVYSYYDAANFQVVYTIRDATNHSILVDQAVIPNSSNAKLAVVDNAVLFIYFDGPALELRVRVIPTYNVTAPVDSVLYADLSGTSIFDVIEISNTLVKVVYRDDSDEVHTFTVNQGGTVSIKELVTTDVANTLAIASTSDVIAGLTSGDVGIYAYNNPGYTATVSTPAGTVTSVAIANDGTTLHAWTSLSGFYPSVAYTDAMDFAAPTSTLGKAVIASTAFLIEGKPYINILHKTGLTVLQSTYFLVDTDGTVHAKCCEGIADPTAEAPARVINQKWAPTYNEQLQIDLDPDQGPEASDIFAQTGIKCVSYNTVHKPSTIEYGRCAYIASGILWQYDGVSLHEQGFHVYPEGVVIADGAGALDTDKSYSYRVYYEWTNARGERQRSTTAQIVTSEGAAGYDLTIPTLTLTNKKDVSIVIYRTEGDPNIIGGAPFYRVSNPNPATAGAVNGYLVNDPTVDTLTWSDGAADVDVRNNELDYLNSNELDHTAPKSAHIIGESKNRVWLAGFENYSRVQYSKLNSRGRDQLEFNDTQIIDVPEEDGPVRAIGALNYHTVIFKENSIYAVSGEGPNNLGQGFFNLPQIVSLDVGCIEQRSLVNIPRGLMFKSRKGIWLVDHNLQTSYIGDYVEQFNDQDITDARVVQKEHQVYFLTSKGRTLVYNYLLNSWSTFSNHEGCHGATWNGVYTYARNDGRIYRQSETAYTDGGVHYSMRFLTAPIHVKGTQGKQRIRHIRLLGEYYSPHQLRVGLKYNHRPGVTHRGTFDPRGVINIDPYGSDPYSDGAYGGDGNPVYQVRFNLPVQKCQVVQFEVDTTNNENAGRAVSIQAIQIEVGAMAHTHELGVERSFTSGDSDAGNSDL